VVQNGVPRPASETRVLQIDAGNSKLAITARMHRRRLRDPQESQLVVSAGVLNPELHHELRRLHEMECASGCT
jgi:hypothetical protein